jgi:lipid-binding SYLF domain-containing protein
MAGRSGAGAMPVSQENPMNRLIRPLLAATLFLFAATPAFAASKEEIDASVKEALATLYQESSAAKDLGAKASGILVFPKVTKAGIGIGGEFGEGALLVGGKTQGYYSTAAGSIGLQLGVQQKSQVIMFMNRKELDKFLNQNHDGWKAGVDGSVALATLGVGGQLDTETAKKPIIGFIFSNKGLMYNLTFEGAKITKLDM